MAAIGVGAIEYLVFQHAILHVESDVTEGNFQLLMANQQSQSLYWRTTMVNWANSLTAGSENMPGCDANAILACNDSFARGLGSQAAAIGTSQSVSFPEMVAILGQRGVIEQRLGDLFQCWRDACCCKDQASK
jgi:hypothetical protein